MCEFCKEHGEGKKWYLNVKNYGHDLLSDIKRKDLIHNFYHSIIDKGINGLQRLEKTFAGGKKVPQFLKDRFAKNNKEVHYGQVIPIEDVRTIFEMSSSVARIACGCRWAAGKKEERCCFGITLDPKPWYKEFDTDYFGKPELAQHEVMSAQAAMEEIERFDRQGLIHSVWTFMTPFIGGICNCDIEGCLAMRSTHGLGLPMMFRAEYIAEINAAACSGCRKCEKLCPVKAIDNDGTAKKCIVDKTKCYGCGVCRSACSFNAVKLLARDSDPVAANLW
jgi:Pyruvate/2-oxoacid:ferredoxin oxidoreductase delta subunit